MSMKPRWLVVAGIVGVLVVAIAAYFVWGAFQAAEFERRVQDLRETGELTRSEGSLEVPPSQNAAEVLTEAAALLARIQSEHEELASVLEDFLIMGWDDPSHPPEDFERLRREWPKLDGYFAALQRAKDRPVFAPPPFEPSLLQIRSAVQPWCNIQDHVELLKLRAKVRPETAVGAVSLLLHVAAGWDPEDWSAVRVRSTVRNTALTILREGMKTGALDAMPNRLEWDRQLGAVDAVAELRNGLRFKRKVLIGNVEAMRHGRDPWAALRRGWNEMGLTSSRGAMPPAWQSKWYGRPLLYHDALPELDEVSLAIERVVDESSVRQSVGLGSDVAESLTDADVRRFAHALGDAAAVRLARIALAVQQQVANGTDVPSGLSGYSEQLGGALPEDPFTGEPVHYSLEDGKVVLSCVPTAPSVRVTGAMRMWLRSCLRWQELMEWDVPLPSKDGH